MTLPRATISSWFLLALVLTQAGFCQGTSGKTIAVLPFVIDHLSTENGMRLRQDFSLELGQTGSFSIQPLTATRSLLEEAGLKKIDDCTTPPCLAQLGKILGVDGVVFVSGSRLADNLTFQVRCVNASDASVIYDHKSEYQGVPDSLLTAVVGEQARRLAGVEWKTGARWYVVAAVVVVSVAVLYGIYELLAPSSSTQSQSPGTAPSPQ